MADKQPTQEEVKEFCEWGGFRFIEDKHYDYTLQEWEVHYPDGEWHHAYKSEIGKLVDLNNLFKYAVPKPIDVHFKYSTSYPEHTIGEINCWLYFEGKKYEGWSYDLALALFWAIWEVLITRKGE